MSKEMTSRELTFEAGLRVRRPWYQKFIGFLRRKPLGTLGLILVTSTALMALLAPFIAPHDPEAINGDYPMVAPGTAGFILGTDVIGRDLLSRLLYGARISVVVGLSVAAVGSTAGAMLGITSAYFGGKVDLTVQRVVDALSAFPSIVLALAIMAALGQSLLNVILALCIVETPRASRTLRSVALSIKETQYVDAARAIGAGHLRIILQHVAINCAAAFLIVASARVGQAIVAEATLSFLGLGTPANVPSWGGMLSGDAQQYVHVAPWLGIFPGLALSLTVFGINLLGDALRDVLDPRLRKG